MMTRVVCGMLLALSLASAYASNARQKVDETKDVSADGFVRVTVVRGSIEIEGWDRNQVRVTGTLDEQMQEFIFDVRRGDTVIEVKLPRNLNNWCCNEGSNLTIMVPKKSSVDVSMVSTDATVSGVVGGVEVHGVSGDIRVTDAGERVDLTSVSGEIDVRSASGRIEMKSVSGDLDAVDISGDIRMHTVSGDIVARKIANELDLESVSGDIDVAATKFSVVRGNTVSGDVDIVGELDQGGRFEFGSVSGSVRARFEGQLDARFDLETGSGTIRNRVTNDRPEKSKYQRDERLRFIFGEGKAEVKIETRSGDIVISRD